MATKQQQLEARIQELEKQNALLLKLAGNVRSDSSDVDIVTHVGNVTVLHKMYGGYAISTDQCKWEDIATFEEVVERLFQSTNA